MGQRSMLARSQTIPASNALRRAGRDGRLFLIGCTQVAAEVKHCIVIVQYIREISERIDG